VSVSVEPLGLNGRPPSDVAELGRRWRDAPAAAHGAGAGRRAVARTWHNCGMDEERALQALERFHERVTRAATALHARHAARTKCARGCSACCVDGLSVFAVEAERIRRRAGALLARDAPHAPGACAFLDDEGACRVYAWRPYVCRTQGLPLRWLDDEGDGEPVELRDACPLNFADGGAPVEELRAGRVLDARPARAAPGRDPARVRRRRRDARAAASLFLSSRE
jgi:hypothetical protein